MVRPHYRNGKGALADGTYKGVAGFDRVWATSDSFKFDDRVPMFADCAELPAEPKYSDALVEAVAWFWTEGHIRKLRDGRQGRNLTISQSAKHPDHCERIRSALTRLFGPAVDRMPASGKQRQTDGIPRWREAWMPRPNRCAPQLYFQLSADAGDVLIEHAPGRVPTFPFLLSLTKAQLGLFIETSMLADNSGKFSLAQKDPAAAEAFQFACVLAGLGTSIKQTVNADHAKLGYQMTNVRMRSQASLWPGRPGVRETVTYSGKVWCPRTPNATWLARRNGTVWFTGNSSWMRDIRLGKAKLMVPQSMLDNIGRGKGAVFEPEREVFVPLNSLSSGDGPLNQTIVPWQPNIRFRAQGHLRQPHRADHQPRRLQRADDGPAG